jgi:hypothetical protein
VHALNALAVEVEQDVERHIPGRDRSWIDAAFKEWGAWIWESRDFEGYPTAEHVTAFLNGAGGGTRGHRVLCRDTPPWVTFTHAIWLRLPEHEAVAMWAEYVPGVGEDGRLWSREQKCQRLGIGEEGFRKRLQRARIRIWEWSRKRRN